jgi:8-amino-7-oxononanoate synthase
VEELEHALRDLDAAGRLRRPVELEPLGNGWGRIGDRDVLVLCGNDYLGLSQSPVLLAALSDGAQRWGVGATGSRLITGTSSVHRHAQSRLAALVQMPAAVLFPTGYQANVGAISALVGPGDCVVSDALNHASIIDGCRLSRAEVRVVSHGSVGAVERALERKPAQGVTWVVTEAVFSMDGDEADLVALSELTRRHDARLLVDEAHSLGVFGPGGAGLCRAQGVVPDALVGTLGKALGCAGAFVAGSASLALWLENRARSYVFTTGMAPPLAAAAGSAADLVRTLDVERAKLLGLARRARNRLAADGIDVPGSGPILPIQVGDDHQVMTISQQLLERGIFVQGIRPPTVPAGSARLRLTVSAAHDPEEVLEACRVVGEVIKSQ